MSLDSFEKLLYIIISLATFFMGATLASGINCLVYRLTIGESWVTGRSHCEHCGHQLSWWELIPVIGCLVLRARCRACGSSFGYKHALLEGTCGLACSVVVVTSMVCGLSFVTSTLFILLILGVVAIMAAATSSAVK